MTKHTTTAALFFGLGLGIGATLGLGSTRWLNHQPAQPNRSTSTPSVHDRNALAELELLREELVRLELTYRHMRAGRDGPPDDATRRVAGRIDSLRGEIALVEVRAGLTGPRPRPGHAVDPIDWLGGADASVLTQDHSSDD